LFVGAHQEGPSWLCTEGMAWLNGRYLAKNKRQADLTAERSDYEAAMIFWIKKLATSEPHRAYYWCVFLEEDYGIGGANAAVLEAVAAPLAANPGCVNYVMGIREISDFSARNYTGFGVGSAFKHTTPKLESAAANLAEKFAGVPMIEEIAKALGQPTCGG